MHSFIFSRIKAFLLKKYNKEMNNIQNPLRLVILLVPKCHFLVEKTSNLLGLSKERDTQCNPFKINTDILEIF